MGFQDETWWSRVARVGMAAWAAYQRPLRLVEVAVPDHDPTPKALACYGLWLPGLDQTWLRFVVGRPISAITTQFLAWCVAETARALPTSAIRTLLLVWDNASWHTSREVRAWVRAHNQTVQRAGWGVKLVPCPLPSQSPWLNPIEPKWLHAKRRIIEPTRVLSIAEVEERVCQVFQCPQLAHLSRSNDVA